MPSTTIQSRISAFESLASSPSPPSSKHISSPSPSFSNGYSRSASDILESPLSPMTAAPLQPVAVVTRPSPSPSPPNLGRKTSLIDLKDWVVDDGPVSTRVASNGFVDSSKTPTQEVFNAKAQSPVSRRTSNGTPLISFNSPPKPKPKPKPANLSAPVKTSPQLPPQLPPRKPSYTSLKSDTHSSSSAHSRRTDSLTVEPAHRYPPLSIDSELKNSSHAPSSSISSFHSVSLSEDNEPSTPGSVTNFIATFPMDSLHNSPPVNRKKGDSDTISLSESYEEVSTSSLASPNTERLISLAWERAPIQRKSVPPKLPDRPNSIRTAMKSTPPSHPVSRVASGSGSSLNSPIIRPTVSAASSSSSIVAPYVPRRSAPPPPSRSSDRASIQSNTTTHSQSSSSQSHMSHNINSPSLLSLKTKRPTPVPFGVRKRYEAVFNANVIQRRKAEKRGSGEKPALLSTSEARGRRAVGWRGLSVDLITGDEMVPPLQNDLVNETVGPTEKLEGAIVKLIWQCSGLDKEILAEIWNECDLTGQGAVSLDAFVKGMWRIDEELRRAQVQAIKSAASGNYRAKTIRPVPKIPQKSRDILR